MPSRLPRFGFECEFGEGGEVLVAELARRDLVANSTMHSWHCDCEDCQFESGEFPFKMQTDSTCSGEVISKPFKSMGEARPYMAALEAAAVEVDAAPGLSAGLHVHVELPPRDHSSLPTAFWQYLRWEPFLTWLAAGRFEEIRPTGGDGLNHPVLDALSSRIINEYRGHFPDAYPYPGVHEALEWLAENNYTDLASSLLERHQANDRHSFLNVQARRQPTWEFRLWNSTRSAWRMEMFANVSRAFMLPAFITALAAESPGPVPDSDASDAFIEALNSVDLTQAAALVARQVEYQDTTEFPISTEFARL